MSRTRPSPHPLLRRQKIAYTLIVLALAGPVLGLVGEGLVRIRHWFKHGTFDRVYGYELHEPSGLKIPEPGTKFGPIRINTLGFRGAEITRPKPSERVRIAFLGGSTTYSAESSSEEATWPALVCRGLAERFPEVDFDYVNAGVGGFTVSHSILNLEHRVQHLEPDVLVIYHATNDLCIDSRAIAREKGIYEGKPDRESWIERWSLGWHLLVKNWRLHQRQATAREGRARLDYQPEVDSAGFQERLGRLLDQARQVAPVVSIATFSTQVRHDQTPNVKLGACNTSLYYMPYMTPEELLEAFDDYNRAIREAARQRDVLLIDAADRVPGDGEHFHDSVHFTDLGSEVMAECVLESLLDYEPLLELIEARLDH